MFLQTFYYNFNFRVVVHLVLLKSWRRPGSVQGCRFHAAANSFLTPCIFFSSVFFQVHFLEAGWLGPKLCICHPRFAVTIQNDCTHLSCDKQQRSPLIFTICPLAVFIYLFIFPQSHHFLPHKTPKWPGKWGLTPLGHLFSDSA